jgi:hypothetical protein
MVAGQCSLRKWPRVRGSFILALRMLCAIHTARGVRQEAEIRVCVVCGGLASCTWGIGLASTKFPTP